MTDKEEKILKAIRDLKDQRFEISYRSVANPDRVLLPRHWSGFQVASRKGLGEEGWWQMANSRRN